MESTLHYSYFLVDPYPHTLELPPHIWADIILRVNNIMWLWTEARRVSKDFHRSVEFAFMRKWIPNKVSINVDAGKFINCKIDSTFKFHHFSEDTKTAFFADPTALQALYSSVCNPSSLLSEAALRQVEYFQCWRTALDTHFKANKIIHPASVVVISHMVNDTYLPRLRFSPETTFVQFEWRGMLSAFFREESQIAKKQKEMDVGIEGLKREFSYLPPIAFISLGMMVLKNNINMIHKTVRRQRIKRDIFLATGYVCKDTDFQDPAEPQNMNFSQQLQTPENTRLAWMDKLRMVHQEEYDPDEDIKEDKKEKKRGKDTAVRKTEIYWGEGGRREGRVIESRIEGGKGKGTVGRGGRERGEGEGGGENYSGLKVGELQEELGRRGLKKTGKKVELIKRLQEDDQGIGERKKIKV